ncbi:MAG: FAD:protein FMN transferase [Acidobacteriota bacterium]
MLLFLRSTVRPIGLAAWLVCAAPLTAQAPDLFEPVRLSMPVFDTEAQVEVRGLPRAQATTAARAALLEIHEMSQLLDPSIDTAGGFGRLQRAAGGDAVVLDARTADFLFRALRFCLWSSGASGPLGGELYTMWRNHREHGVALEPLELRTAVDRANCEALTLDPGTTVTASLAAEHRLSGLGMDRGFAIDRALSVLREHGVGNAFVEIGLVVRAMGGGPEGRGWRVAVPGVPGTEHPIDEVWLRDSALAILRPDDSSRPQLPLDQRRGVPSRGVVQVAVVSRLAVETEVIAATLYSVGLTHGNRLLGGLDPRPSVFWLLGNNVGRPLESTYRWSELPRPGR